MLHRDGESNIEQIPFAAGQPLTEWRPAKSTGYRVALLVANECIRHGLAAMLNSLVSVADVRAWDNIYQAFPWSQDMTFDVLILRFGDLDAEVADKLARDAWAHGKKVLILLDQDDEDMVDLVTSIPSNGFLLQNELTTASLAAAFARVSAGDVPLPPRLTNRLLARAREGTLKASPPGSTLTPRERQVLELLVAGLSNKHIARRLYISQHGVKRLVSNVLAKLNCPNRTQAVAIALTDGILTKS